MKKFNIQIIISISLFLFLGLGVKAQQNTQDLDKAKSIAVSELSHILSMMPEGEEKDYGFDNRDEFKLAKIDDFVLCENIAHDKNVEFVKYRFLVSVKGTPKALLAYKKEQGDFIMCGFGASSLAKEVVNLKNKIKSESTIVQLVRVNDINFKGDFVKFENTIEKNLPQNGFVPLYSASNFLEFTEKSVKPSYTLEEIISLGIE